MDNRVVKFTKLLPQLQLSDLCGFAKGLNVPLIDIFGIKTGGKPPTKKQIIDFQVEIAAQFSKLPPKRQKDFLKVAKMVAAENISEHLETVDMFLKREGSEEDTEEEGDGEKSK